MVSTGERHKSAGWRILIVGTGGQGVLTVARLLCNAFVERGHSVVSGQLHGMAQRGGSVQSSVMIDRGISPVIPRGGADFVLGFEPVETARALPFMSSRTVVYMNTAAVVPYVLAQQTLSKKDGEAEYPDVQHLADSIRAVTANAFLIDATDLAVEAGSIRSLNMVMLGCLLGSGSTPYSPEDFWNMVGSAMPSVLREINSKAFFSGAELGRGFRLCEDKG
ncbi:MAG: indolepyruvate oxidoreductase subunit beta [Planctomycetota bacterium]|jgi:indolepyruvate ferredoxin oxidoreductase beta subunit